jgi:hypothetical protein
MQGIIKKNTGSYQPVSFNMYERDGYLQPRQLLQPLPFFGGMRFAFLVLMTMCLLTAKILL